MLDILNIKGLGDRIVSLDGGMDCLLSSTGWPLICAETMRLKLAGALLARPRVLILSGLFDMVPVEELRPALRQLDDCETTIIFFTCRPDAFEFDHMLWLGQDTQLLTQDRAAFAAARNAAKARNSAEGGFHALPR